MTKKDFELIAQTIRQAELRPRCREHLARDFAYNLATTNPRFDRARFVAACIGEDSTDSAGRKVSYS